MTTEVGRARPLVISGLLGGLALMLIAIAVAVLTAGPGSRTSPTPEPSSTVVSPLDSWA